MFISMNTQIGILCVLCVLLGVLVGLFMARAAIRGAKKSGALMMNVNEAPAPVDLGYDPSNPMNAGRPRKTVKECGYEWTVIS